MVFDASSSWVIAISVAVIFFVMVSSFLAYFCGCCKKIPRDELLGLSGIVKITNPDTEQNHGPVAISITRTPSEENIHISSIPSSNASAKRLNGIGNNVCNPGTATRSLPELPVGAAVCGTSNRSDEVSSNFISYSGLGDTNSDLYATLEEHKFGTSVIPKSKLSPNGTLYSSTPTSGLAATYEQIDDDTTYIKLKGEHPYAQVTENDSATSSVYGPDHSTLDRMNVSAVDEIDGVANIPAASAIAGSVAASNELPYMTPPLHSDHFSGDSQDSAKGYTSITVREPLARIRPNQSASRDVSDSHYTVLSDDSDEMYAAIQDAYTSGSETYAQIQPLPSTNPTYCSVPETVSEASSSQKFGTSSAHSRQASTSSVASSLTNRNSPKEKRQANSPLPKPPDITADDMYAKVLKKRRNENDRCSSRDSVYHSDPDSASSLNFHAGPSSSGELAVLLKLEHRDVEKSDRELGEDDEDDSDRYACGYETLPERNYEMLADVNQSAGYETVKENFHQNAGYESLPELDSLTPGYESIRESAGGYEKIKYATKEDESDPNYEELKPQITSEQFHCYATINKNGRTSSSEHVMEPDYASLTRHAVDVEYDNGNENDPFYERIQKRATNALPTGENEDTAKHNDKNNNHSNPAPESEQIPKDHSISESSLNELYSKVNKNVKR